MINTFVRTPTVPSAGVRSFIGRPVGDEGSLFFVDATMRLSAPAHGALAV